MNRLLDIGFEPAGRWTLVDSEFRLELVRHMTRSNVLYAFVCDGAVVYVGKTTKQPRRPDGAVPARASVATDDTASST